MTLQTHLQPVRATRLVPPKLGWGVAIATVVALGYVVFQLMGGLLRDKGQPLNQAASATESTDRAAGIGQGLTVQTVLPGRADLIRKFEQAAAIVALEEAELYTRASGYVQNVDVDIGDLVSQDKVLLTLDAPDLQQDVAYKDAVMRQAEAEEQLAQAAVHAAEAELLGWKAQFDEAEADIKKADSDRKFRKRHAQRFADLGAKEAVPADLVEEKRDQADAAQAAYESSLAKSKSIAVRKATLVAKLEGAKADQLTRKRRVEVAKADRDRSRVLLDYTNLRAPFPGVITRRTVDSGAYVAAGSSGKGKPVLTLARIDQVTAVLRVPERDAGYVRKGMRARVRLEALGGKEAAGKVARYSRSLDEESRTMRVEIDIDNPSGMIYPGMYGPVTLILQEMKNSLTIPASAVYTVGDTTYVVEVRDNQAHRLAVEIGHDDGKVVQIVKGLRGVEQIIVSNKGQISEGQQVEPHRIDRPERDK